MSDLLFGVDVGGSGIKAAIVDASLGDLKTERYRVKTPQPATPAAVAACIAHIVRHFGWEGPIGAAIPTVVRGGIVTTAANIDKAWIGLDADHLLEETTGSPVRVLNDADAAGIAEMVYGVGAGETGVVILLTFGTGIGSALFHDGILVPNSELGHLEFKGMIAEHYAAARLVEREDMDLDPWAIRVGEFLNHLERVLTPDLFIFGGGISKRFDEFSNHLHVDTPVKVAELRNNAGIVGAALASRGLTPAERSNDEEHS
ncbi:MAG: ROK family protein [Acidimicrobiia bacterium]|nr:ROK family protein [Acidimicrobiia bacterium]